MNDLDITKIKWFDKEGKKYHLTKEDWNNKYIVLFCFQDWCPGCHSRGFPSLQELYKTFKDDERVILLAVQTVFEGFEINTLDRGLLNQKKYNLPIIFGHDASPDNTRSEIMKTFGTGGTPWFVLINQKGIIEYQDWHINPIAVIEHINEAIE